MVANVVAGLAATLLELVVEPNRGESALVWRPLDDPAGINVGAVAGRRMANRLQQEVEVVSPRGNVRIRPDLASATEPTLRDAPHWRVVAHPERIASVAGYHVEVYEDGVMMWPVGEPRPSRRDVRPWFGDLERPWPPVDVTAGLPLSVLSRGPADEVAAAIAEVVRALYGSHAVQLLLTLAHGGYEQVRARSCPASSRDS